VTNLAAEGLTSEVHLVGDVMRDLAARTLAEVRDASALAGVAGGGLRTGEFLFATVHRAENRAPDAIRGWVGVLDSVARADRPVVLALHPGTRAAMESLGVAPSSNVIVVEPLGYRSSLAAQLHAAAVLTDSGGVQREAAWLGTPCLVLRGSTEWVETTAGDAATSVLVGLDAVRAREALDRLAPPDRAPADARLRAQEREIETDDATASIARLLA
jgi:UDP-N-acetylglucosamine 2-epimerase